MSSIVVRPSLVVDFGSRSDRAARVGQHGLGRVEDQLIPDGNWRAAQDVDVVQAAQRPCMCGSPEEGAVQRSGSPAFRRLPGGVATAGGPYVGFGDAQTGVPPYPGQVAAERPMTVDDVVTKSAA